MPEKRPTVCVDLDGVLASYKDGWQGIDQIGDPIPGAVEFVEALNEFADVLVYTARTNADANPEASSLVLVQNVEGWLAYHGFTAEIYRGPGKPLAEAYVDDRAVVCRPETDQAYNYVKALVEIRGLCLGGGPLGGTGEYPYGKMAEDDEGELRLAISSDGSSVRIDFGKPVAWLGLTTEEARGLAAMLLKHARG